MTHDDIRDQPEIERKYLLRVMPRVPDNLDVESLDILQGYLDPPEATDDPPTGEPLHEGRLRRTTYPDGRIVCHHTIKTGLGLVRRERERTIPPETFERKWPETIGQRLRKRRHRVRVDDLVWEIDEFLHPQGLVLAEVELPHDAVELALPPWISEVLVREVTDEPRYNNRAIARRAPEETSGSH